MHHPHRNTQQSRVQNCGTGRQYIDPCIMGRVIVVLKTMQNRPIYPIELNQAAITQVQYPTRESF